MPTKIVPYLFLNGTAGEAIAFYAAAGLGRPHRLSHYRDGPPMPHLPENWGDRLMHGEIVGEHLTVMLSDTPDAGPITGAMLAIGLSDRAEADRLFAALSEGGEIRMPMKDMFWGAYYGQFTDRFGVRWMINCEPEPTPAT